MQIIELCRNS